MSKFKLVLLMIFFSSAALAESVVFVCERPAWEGVKGCGPNNTYMTYKLYVETDDFDHKHPVYDFQQNEGCGKDRGTLWTYKYAVNDDSIEFLFNRVPSIHVRTEFLSTIKIDRKTMKAVMSKVEHGTELTCTQEPGPDRRPGTSPARDGY